MECADEKNAHGNELGSCDAKTIAAEQGHESKASRNSSTDHAADTGANPCENQESGTQNPPVQVTERPTEDHASASLYKIPSHVFDRTSTTTPEWSTTSNESLFSIQMGSLSFSRELNWFKSGELDKCGDMSMCGPPNSSQSNMFNDMSQRSANQDEGSGVTEAKAAETMREVIRESANTNSNDQELSIADKTSHSNLLSSPSNQSGHSDVSTKSFAFQSLTGDGVKSKSGSSRRSKERHIQQKHSSPLSLKETTNEAEIPNSGTTASTNRWLSCFACCPFYH